MVVWKSELLWIKRTFRLAPSRCITTLGRNDEFRKLGHFQKKKFWFFCFYIPNLNQPGYLKLCSLYPNQRTSPLDPLFPVKNIRQKQNTLAYSCRHSVDPPFCHPTQLLRRTSSLLIIHAKLFTKGICSYDFYFHFSSTLYIHSVKALMYPSCMRLLATVLLCWLDDCPNASLLSFGW